MDDKFYKKKYSIRQFYIILYKAIRTMSYLRRAKKEKLIDSKFMERIMLAVTEVNGCPICAYGHTKMALEIGLNEEEIKQLLSGETKEIPISEGPAIIFAQHYADAKGNPSQASWERMVEIYGATKAKGILGTIRMIMMGNVYGMALSAFGSRLKGKAVKLSFFYEIGLILSLIIFLPVAIVHAIVSKLFKRPII